MVTAADISQMPQQEKLRVMELLWSDLTADESALKSPSWHGDALRATEALGEEPVDWDEAKAALRAERG
jgi:hypothetical protein